ncbi:hypothetical protein SAMN06265218_113113 [Fodinibius sediminis]|uniref:Uncharacterized protein n=1 Tax=Fodinibius sediminis TaxID=1214077 RepID=A0A521E5T8_9BACT|nr:hypothetical protein SAMN06265218_113113 [Fodinibius sediminis]
MLVLPAGFLQSFLNDQKTNGENCAQMASIHHIISGLYVSMMYKQRCVQLETLDHRFADDTTGSPYAVFQELIYNSNYTREDKQEPISGLLQLIPSFSRFLLLPADQPYSCIYKSVFCLFDNYSRILYFTL